MSERPLPGWPRALNEELAAAYLSLSPSLFRTEVAARRAPQPFWLTVGRKAWLREDLDAYLDRMAGRDPVSLTEDWRRTIRQDGAGGSSIR